MKSITVGPDSPIDIDTEQYQQLSSSVTSLKANLSEQLQSPLVSLSTLNPSKTSSLATELGMEFDESLILNQQIIKGIDAVSQSLNASDRTTVQDIVTPETKTIMDDVNVFLNSIGVFSEFVSF